MCPCTELSQAAVGIVCDLVSVYTVYSIHTSLLCLSATGCTQERHADCVANIRLWLEEELADSKHAMCDHSGLGRASDWSEE